MINGYQEKIDQISIKGLTDFGRMLWNINWIYTEKTARLIQA